MQAKRQRHELPQVSRALDGADFDRHRLANRIGGELLSSAVQTARADHVQVAAPPGCEEAARRFYGELIGLPELEKPAQLRGRGGVWFSLSGAQLHVGVAERFVAADKAHAALRVTPRGWTCWPRVWPRLGRGSCGTTSCRA